MKILQIGIPGLSFFGLWLILSGHYDFFHISLGLFSTAVVILLVWRLSIVPEGMMGADIWSSVYGLVRWRHALLYPFRLLVSIMGANLQVAALVLNPKLPIDPVLLRFKAPYRSDAAKILLGNSITLTPGTVTLDIENDVFTVHALTPALATSLFDGSDPERVARVFGDTVDITASLKTARRLEELS